MIHVNYDTNTMQQQLAPMLQPRLHRLNRL